MRIAARFFDQSEGTIALKRELDVDLRGRRVRFVLNSDVACPFGSEAIVQTDADDVELIAKGCVERRRPHSGVKTARGVIRTVSVPKSTN